MSVRRGQWKTEKIDRTATVKSGRYGARPADVKKQGTSNSEYHMITRSSEPNSKVLEDVSDHRKEELIRGTNVKTGDQSTGPVLVYSSSYRRSQEMKEKFTKTAGITTSDSSSAGSAGTVRQAPYVYSPLFQIANLQLPRDRITMNAWNRNFYDTHPLVHNCINLHATYPISKLNIKCKDRKIEQFFNDMAEEMNLKDALQAISLEYWKLGEMIGGDTLITMADGTLKKVTNINIGDYVLTHLGNKKKVINKFIKPTSRVSEEHINIYKIKSTGTAEDLIISGRHPVYSLDSDLIKCNTPSCSIKSKNGMRILPGSEKCTNCGKKYNSKLTPKFYETNELKEGDIVFSPFNVDITENKEFSKQLCYIMGYWLAEGYYHKEGTKYNGIRFCSYDNKYLEEFFIPMFENYMGKPGIKYTRKSSGFVSGKDKYDYWYTGKKRNARKLARFFLEHCGEYSKTKKMSEAVMKLSPELQKYLLAGFIDGDGCVDQSNGHIIICTSSRDLANQFAIMLRRAGLTPMVNIGGYSEAGNAKYRVKIKANQAYSNFVELLRSDKRKLLRTTKYSSNHTTLHNNAQTLTIDRISDITNVFTDNFMYDIEVEDDHSYIANGIAIHNCFPYLELDDDRGVWKNIIIQNPDYIHVKTSVLSGETIISMRPDAALQRLVHSSSPADLQIRRQIDDEIIYHVKKGNNIPLDNFHVSQLAMKSSPYDVHGTSLIVSVYKDLMLYDRFRECHDIRTKVLTDRGIFDGLDLIEYEIVDNQVSNVRVKDGVKIACFNPENEKIEYHKPTNVHLSHYNGKMYHFVDEKTDIMVTPHHRMWAKTQIDGKSYTDWHFEYAENIHSNCKFKTYGSTEDLEFDKKSINKVDYNDLVWCFEVPTGLFVTKRNGKFAIQGNSKYSQADNLINPITLVKVGGATEGEYKPTPDDLEKWRQTFEAAQYDHDFKIISHAAVAVERIGASGQIIDISADVTQILDNILYGLMTPKAVITQEGAAFNTATIGLEVLKQRYESFRNMMAQWLIKKVFAPISEIQEFYEYKDGDKKLIVPEIEWNKMILFDMDNYINILNGLVGQNMVSRSTLYKSLGLSVEEERRLIKEEMINNAILAKEQQILQGMSLSTLRSIKADEDIIEPTEAPLPGTPGAEEAGIPGTTPATTGGPGLGMGTETTPLGGPLAGEEMGPSPIPLGGPAPSGTGEGGGTPPPAGI